MNQTSTPGFSRTPEISTIAGFPALRGIPSRSADREAVFLLLHGAFADHLSWRTWVEHLARLGYVAIAPARRGRAGVPPEQARGVTFDDYLTDCLNVLDELERQHGAMPLPVIVGHSLGGLLAQRLAEMGRASALVLLASAPPEPLTAQEVALPYFGPLMPAIMDGLPFVVPDEACSVLALNQVPEHERPAIHARLTEESGLVYRDLLAGSITVDPALVRIPVFVAGARDDRIIAVEHVERTAQHFGTEPRIYPGHGHWMIDEPGTTTIIDEVLAWLHDELP